MLNAFLMKHGEREMFFEMPFEKPHRIINAKLLKEIRKKACCVCGNFPVDASHIRTRASGGPDDAFNVVPHCRSCHVVWGRLGAYKFCLKHPKFKSYLESLGWYWDGFKLKHPELEFLKTQITEYKEKTES